MLAQEFVCEQVDDAIVEVVAAEEGVATGREDFEDVVADLEYGDIEGSATEIPDRAFLAQPSSETVCERCCSWFVEDSQDVVARD